MDALLVVDAQVNMFKPSPAHDAGGLLTRIVALRRAAAEHGIQVVFVRNAGREGAPDVPGSPGWEIHPDLAPSEADAVVEKYESDSFTSPGLVRALEALGVTTVVIAGLQSEYCIRATARGAREHGFAVILVRDGHSTYDGESPAAATIERINAELGAIATILGADEVTRRWAPPGRTVAGDANKAKRLD